MVSIETIAITDERLGGVWGKSLNRILFRAAGPPLRGRWDFYLTAG
jgi:hypothetical protein